MSRPTSSFWRWQFFRDPYKVRLKLKFSTAKSFLANSDNPCDGVTCSNKGFCVPSELYNNGYWCECDEGWVGQNCGHPQPSVVCGDADISITIDTGIVEELNLSTEADFVYFGNSDPQGTSEEHSKCSARLENGKFELKLDAPFLSCGTQVISKVST